MDFAFQFLKNTVLPEAQLFKAHADVTLLVQEAMNSRSPNLYLLMIQLVDQFCTKAGVNNDPRQGSNKRELVEVIQNLVECCLKIANDHRATVSRMEAEKDQSFEEKKQRIRALSQKTIHTLAKIVPSLYDHISEDKNRAVAPVIVILMSYLRDRSEHNLPWSRVSALFLLKLIQSGYSTKLMTKQIVEIFYDNNFFYMDYVALSYWCEIINHLMNSEKAHLTELLRKPKLF